MRQVGASPPREGGGGKAEAPRPERPSECGPLELGMSIEQMLALTVRLQHAEVLSRVIGASPIAQQLKQEKDRAQQAREAPEEGHSPSASRNERQKA